MQKGKAVFFGIVMILVNFCIAVCIQGVLFCPISSPLQAESLAKAYGEYKNAHILDHTVLKDSELLLVESEGDVQILELQRNLFFPRYCLLEAHDIPEDDSSYTTAAVTSIPCGRPKYNRFRKYRSQIWIYEERISAFLWYLHIFADNGRRLRIFSVERDTFIKINNQKGTKFFGISCLLSFRWLRHDHFLFFL